MKDLHLKKHKNAFLPESVKVLESRVEAPGLKTIRLSKPRGFSFTPGEFVLLTVYGIGEAAFSVSSDPKSKFIELTVRGVGNVSHAIHELKKRDLAGLRGPFGRGYPLDKVKKRNLVLIAGGCGIAPVRSAYLSALKKAASVQVFYGAKTVDDLAFKKELDSLAKKKKFDVYYAVEKPVKKWRGFVGFLNEPLKQLVKPGSMVFSCGPEIMMTSTAKVLQELGIRDEDVFFSLERTMQCGIGKCGHCTVRGHCVCLDGPVFSLKQVKEGDLLHE
ncbi:MAG: FAD/NAD(P)-binding protein [Candidatus Micrarchaeota archaeon]